MFSRAATKTLTTVARRNTSTTLAKNGSKVRAFSDVAASVPKQPMDVPPPSAAKPLGAHGHRHCRGSGKRFAGKTLVLGSVGYGGYWYGSNYGGANPGGADEHGRQWCRSKHGGAEQANTKANFGGQNQSIQAEEGSNAVPVEQSSQLEVASSSK